VDELTLTPTVKMNPFKPKDGTVHYDNAGTNGLKGLAPLH